MPAPLNFGPSEQTIAQRQAIAQQALALLEAEDAPASVTLREMYEQYVAGEVDLYAISQHVREELRQQVEALAQSA